MKRRLGLKIKTKKASNLDTNGYDTTEEYSVLMCANVSGNNNKFYCIELQKNASDNYRIFTHYGRLGMTDTFDVREEFDDGSPLDKNTAVKEYTKILKKKLRGKKMDGYVEKYEVVETDNPSVGSDNLRQKKIDAPTVVSSSTTEQEVSYLVNQIFEENIHNIQNLVDIALTDNGFETPLGPLTGKHLDKAKEPLSIIKELIQKGVQDDNTDLLEANTYFFSLIPHKFGSRISSYDLITSNEKLLDKYNLLETMKSAVDMGSNLQSSSNDRYSALGVDIRLLRDKIEQERITDYLLSTRASNHTGLSVYGMKVKNIFDITIPFERKRFIDKGLSVGNKQELFHGSRNGNILSILKNGLMIFKSHPTKAGDMFGPGLYFADSSTKSANYSSGFWGGVRNKYNSNFMFLADVALGNIKEERSSKYYTEAPAGYHSVKGCKGSYLYNNEFIVYKPEQATLKYLVEFTC